MKNNSSKTLGDIIAERSNNYTFLEEKYQQMTERFLVLDPFSPPPNLSSALPLSVSIVIPAYNAEASIFACLVSIERSSFNLNHQNKLQVIVVDDGSTDNTWNIIKKSKFSMHLTVVKQTNHGQAQALNTGASIAEGDIIIFCDADMVLSYYTIDHLMTRHQKLPNVLLTGFRSDVLKTDHRVNPEFIREPGVNRSSYFIKDERIVFPTPGWPRNMCLASNHYKRLGHARGLWMPDDDDCEDPWLLSDLVIGALFSLSKEVFLSVGGYDERLHGWGCTDALLAAKAISTGQYVIPVYAASGLHISHPFRTKDKQLEYAQNRKKFFEIIETEQIDRHPDWIVRAKNRIIESIIKNPIQKSFKSTENLISKNTESLWSEIDSLLAIGEYSKAFIALSSRLTEDNNPEKLLRLGKILFGLGRYHEAINVLKELSGSMKISTELAVELSTAYAATGQFVKANKILMNLSRIHWQFPELSYLHQYSIQKHLVQGKKYFEQGFYDVAIRCFEISLIGEPKNKIALKYLEQCGNRIQ
ncbi:MAG: glycosyltransferase [Patescibacteria group bacterium]